MLPNKELEIGDEILNRQMIGQIDGQWEMKFKKD